MKICFVPLCLNYNRVHFYWTDGENFYHYTNPNPKENEKINFWFEGEYVTHDVRHFGGVILFRMKRLNWSFEKQARVARKLGLNWSAEGLREDAEFAAEFEAKYGVQSN